MGPVELREPPRRAPRPRPDRLLRALAAAHLVVLLLAAAWLVARRPGAESGEGEVRREVAAKLLAAGAVEEAALQYGRYLEGPGVSEESRSKIAFSLGSAFLDSGRHEQALRWLYEAESRSSGDLDAEIGAKIVHALERLGRHHAARSALGSRSGPDGRRGQGDGADPVVARIDGEEFRRSDLDRTLDELPPEVAGELSTAEGRGELLRRFVADELLWRKALKLELDDHPEVRRRHAALLRQLAVSRLVEEEIVERLAVEEVDLRNFFAARQDRYRVSSSAEGEPRQLTFDEVRSAVERDYRMEKLQAAYEAMIDRELATADVELFPERLEDAG